ncbi:hypothetical protein HNQ91_000545 [Filimonas zeae]|uniref:Uncharacterized protein n=1 Tax=Filimonas zeae TaxID=1737353 RepID=A0A917MR38_9BACT|nr:hypothetical protein [Filimonas zeae]MDR6337523.1 hypothetical protein [Filimonas zeae]GGH59018.1 hypothetical protein GCM10011379_05340 [Filimonas zeae]
MTSETLQRLEQNTEVKKHYASAGALGKNKLAAIPLVLAVFSAFGAYFFYDISKNDAAYSSYLYVAIGVFVACVIAFIVMQKAAYKKTLETLDEVPACVAKVITGNSEAQLYYGIYTTGRRRHDIDFIEGIAWKIANVEEETDNRIKTKIRNMFAPKLESAGGGTPLPLPEEFTDGEKVFQRQFRFGEVKKATRDALELNDGRFAVLAFNNKGVLVENEHVEG